MLFMLPLLSIFAVSSNNFETVIAIENSQKHEIRSEIKYENSNSESNVLKVYNWEDYIYQDDDGNMTLISDFEKEYNCKVVYDTFDTNETMLSKVKLGVTNYDLICPSDYTIQRMIADDLLIPFDDNGTPTYDKYVSRYLNGKLAGIKVNEKEGVVEKYSRGYMWGTLGIMYNPEYSGFSEAVKSTIHEDMGNWNSLWDTKYDGTFYLKDSMRDTYAVGIMRAFDKEFSEAKTKYDNGEYSYDEYNAIVTKLFNLCDEESAKKVFSNLKDLNANGASFEIDEGKLDMQKGYIGIDIAWSGDASYAMYNADKNNLSLYYQVPKTGGNIWFDGWVMPKGANKDLAQKFIDFLSRPKNAIANGDYIGYVPFIAGDEMLDYIKENYDVSADATIANEDKFDRDISYLFKDTLENYTLDDCKLKIEEEHRQFDTCYPQESELAHLAVMNDFGNNLQYVVSGWEQFRGQEIPNYAYILFGVSVGLIIAGIVFYKVRKHSEMKRRKERREKGYIESKKA